MKVIQDYEIFDFIDRNDKLEKIRIFVPLGPKEDGTVTHIETKDDKEIYTGFLWKIFTEIIKQKEIIDKYRFEFIFSTYGIYNYDLIVDEINMGKYDMALTHLIQTVQREMKVNFAVPLVIDSITVFHKVRVNRFDTIRNVLSSVFVLLIILVILGILVGYILYAFDKDRRKHIDSKLSDNEFLTRTIMTGVASFFGEMGYLSENVSNTKKGVVIVTVIMLFVTIFTLFLQAEITSKTIEERQSHTLSKHHLRDKPILGHEGYAMAKKLEEQGAIIEYNKNTTNKQLFEKYLRNSNKYNGIVLTYCDGINYIMGKSDLTSTSNFGMEPISFVINNEKTELLKLVNKTILTLRSEGTLHSLCLSSYSSLENTYICSLR